MVTAEAVLAALVVGMALPQGVLLLPYLVVPVADRRAQPGRALTCCSIVGIEVVAMTAVTLASGRIAGSRATVRAPGSVVADHSGRGPARGPSPGVPRRTPGSARDASYESARRLLSQLRTVARRLSSGLDTVTLASDLLRTVQQHLDDTHAAVFTRTDGGVLAPLGYRGPGARDVLQPDGHLVERCWHEMEPMHEIQASGDANRRHRVVLPLRVGSRLIGVVVSEAGTAADAQTPQRADARGGRARPSSGRSAHLRRDPLAGDHPGAAPAAREIHDGVAQEIASLGYVVDDLTAGATSDAQRRKLNELRGELSRVVSELRLSIFDLRTEVSAGLGSALSDYVREVGSRSGMTVHTTLDVAPTPAAWRGRDRAVPDRAGGDHQRSQALRRQEPVGRLSDPPSPGHHHRPRRRQRPRKARDDSFGIKVMRERAERINATLDISSVGDSSTDRGPG